MADKVGLVLAPVEAQDIISRAEALARDLLETLAVAPYCSIALRSFSNFAEFKFDADIIASDICHQLMR